MTIARFPDSAGALTEKSAWHGARAPRNAVPHAILPTMKTALTAVALVAAACLLAACASNPADRYEAPPKDGSVSANSADVADNPGMPDNAPKK